MCTTIMESQYRTGKDYVKALRERDYHVVYDAEYILEQITDIPEEEVTLVQVAPEDLGLRGHLTIRETLDAAKICGYELCPLWVAPQYRLQSSDNATAIIGMEPTEGPDGGLNVFSIVQLEDSRLLLSLYVEYCWNADYPLVLSPNSQGDSVLDKLPDFLKL